MIWIYTFIGTAVSFLLRLAADKAGGLTPFLLHLSATAVRTGVSAGILLNSGDLTLVLLFLLICLCPDLVLSLYRLKQSTSKEDQV